MALDKPWIPCGPKEIKNVFPSQNILFSLCALNHPEEFKLGERNSSYYPSDLGNLPAVMEQIFCEKSWCSITALIRSAWAGGVVRVDDRAWCLQVLASGSNICCYYLTGVALRYDSASFYWSALTCREETVFGISLGAIAAATVSWQKL